MLTFLLVSSLVALAQCQNAPTSCNETTSMAFDAQEFSGIWYEVGRNPAPASSVLCAQVNLTLQSNNVMDIVTTYSVTPDYPWVNQTVIGSFDVGDANNPYGYNFSYTLRYPLPVQTYKLLYTDYTNYALLCGYENVNDNSTYFYIIMTRDRLPSGDTLNKYEDMAAQNYSWFSNSSLTVIVQEETCYLSAAPRLLPLIAHFLCLLVFFFNF